MSIKLFYIHFQFISFFLPYCENRKTQVSFYLIFLFVCSKWSDEDSPGGEDSLQGRSVEQTTSNEYGGRKSLETKFEGVVDYDFKNKFEAIEEEGEDEREDEAGM